MPNTDLSFRSRWNRTLVHDREGSADLMIRITASPRPTHTERSPIDVAFVIDRSGSMGGQPIEAAKNGVRMAVDHLDHRDRAAVVIYDDVIDVIQALAPVSPAARRAIGGALDDVEARGSTNLGEGWLVGCRQIAPEPGVHSGHRLRRTILLTDGQANVGMVDPAQLAHHAANLRMLGVTTTTLGFGEHFDEQLLSAMAEGGGGNFEYIRSSQQLIPFFNRELGDMLNAVAIGLTLRVTLPEGVRGEVISFLPHTRHDKTFEINVGDLPAGESVDVLMHVTTRRGNPGDLLPISLDAHWGDPIADIDRTWSAVPKPLTRAIGSAVDAAKIDEEVAEKSALQRAANAQREALKLDRAGRHAESRARMRDSHQTLAEAPMTDRVLKELRLMDDLASAPVDAVLSEHAHKRTASRVSRMGRGRRDREESLSDD